MEKPSIATRLHTAIKHDLKAGRYPPGTPIPAAAIARDQATSIIPVREALYRLAGERWVEIRHHNGFYARRLDETGLRQLYQWELYLLLLALDQPELQPPGNRSIGGETAPLGTIEALFSQVANAVRNRQLRHALRDAVDHLHPIRLTKHGLCTGWPMHCQRLLEAWQHGDPSAFIKTLIAYHDHRLAWVPDIVGHLNAAACG